MQRQSLRIRFDTDLFGPSAHDEGKADIVDLHHLVLELLGDVIEGLIGPAARGTRRRRQGQDDDRNVVDASRHDARLWDADRYSVVIRADFFMNPHHRIVGIGADKEARRDQNMIVRRLAVDMLNAVDAFDDSLQRLGDQLSGIWSLQAVGAHLDIHHGHADLRLFFARDRDEREKAHTEGSQEKERR